MHESAQFNACISHRRPLRRNEFLHHVGTALTSLYVLHSGFLMTRVMNDAGHEHITFFSMPGELVGLEAVSAGRHQCETAALEDSHVCGMTFAILSSSAAEFRNCSAIWCGQWARKSPATTASC